MHCLIQSFNEILGSDCIISFITSPWTINENSVFKKPSIKFATRIIGKSNVVVTRTCMVFKVSAVFTAFLNCLDRNNNAVMWCIKVATTGVLWK